jgi:hypothetical protein
MAEAGLLLAVIVVPISIGVAAAYLRRPWWWGAVAAIVVFLVAALAPEPGKANRASPWEMSASSRWRRCSSPCWSGSARG